MDHVSKSGMRWIGAALTVVVVAAVAWAIWNVRSHKATSPTGAIAQNKPAMASPSQQPLAGEVASIPKFLPGETCEKVTEILGKPSTKDQYGSTWKKQGFEVAAGTTPDCILTNVSVFVSPGHTVATQDGIVIGKTTVADIERIFKARIAPSSESIDAPEGEWELNIELQATPEAPYKETYSTFLHQKPSERSKVEARDPVLADFQSLPVTSYSVDRVSSESPKE
jgi:hypothetical protein